MPAQPGALPDRRSLPPWHWSKVLSQAVTMRLALLWAVVAVALGTTVAACSGGPKVPTVPKAGSQPATTAAPAGGPGSSGHGPLAEAEAYSRCMRSHGVPNFPDPVLTPSGGYGYRTTGIDPNAACVPRGAAGVQGPPLSVAAHPPAAVPHSTAGVVELGQVHPRPRGAELPRPDLFWPRSPDFRPGRARRGCRRRWTPASRRCRPLVALAGDRQCCHQGPRPRRGVPAGSRVLGSVKVRSWSYRLLGPQLDECPVPSQLRAVG